MAQIKFAYLSYCFLVSSLYSGAIRDDFSGGDFHLGVGAIYTNLQRFYELVIFSHTKSYKIDSITPDIALQ